VAHPPRKSHHPAEFRLFPLNNTILRPKPDKRQGKNLDALRAEARQCLSRFRRNWPLRRRTCAAAAQTGRSKKGELLTARLVVCPIRVY
jgi:hypothetical protein